MITTLHILLKEQSRDWGDTDPLLPALVEGLSLVHAVPAAKAPAVPVVTKVAVFVAIISTVTTPLLVL